MEPIRGRGTAENPKHRFTPIEFERDPEDQEHLGPATQYLRDDTHRILARNDSPDVGFSVSINPYRGCEHGCVYCYARPTHEYLGYSAGLDFESRIFVKENASSLLREELASPRYQPEVIAISGVTDCYQPAERHFKLTRRCLEVLEAFRNPVVIITKSQLVTRDLDLFRRLREFRAIKIYISVTTLDSELCGILEPRAARPSARLEAISELAEAEIPVGVLVAPVIPALTDHEMPKILQAAAEAGATSSGYVPLRLPFGVKDLFSAWLERHVPDRRQKILNRITEIRGGKLNDPNFNSRMRGEGIFAEQLKALYRLACKKSGLDGSRDYDLTTEFFRRVKDERQLDLF